MAGSGSGRAPSTLPGDRPEARTPRRWAPPAFAALVLALWFGFLGVRGLYYPDEGRYAEIPREMLATGDWVTPRINGYAYFEKPPLQYWLTAATFAVAGQNAWTARFVPALAGLAGVLAVLLTARRLLSRRAGWMAAAVMAGSCGYFLSAQFVTLDMLLTALLACALCAFLLAQDARATAADCRRWMLVAWALCGLAVLTKGVVGIVLPALAIGTYVALRRDWALLRRLHIATGLLVALAITLPWFVVVEARNPGFSEFFFVREHWQRFTQPLHQRTGPLWYFVPIAVVFLLPWLPAMTAALARSRRGKAAAAPQAFDPGWFGWCWAGAIFVFFSVSSSKLPAYVMPALAGVAFGAAAPLARNWAATVRITAWTLVAGGVLGIAAAVPAAQFIKVPLVQQSYAANAGWLVAGSAILVATGVVVLALVRSRRRVPALAVLVAGGMLGCQVGAVAAQRIDGYFSARRVLDAVTQGQRPFRPEVPFYSVDMFDHTVPFYLGRTVVLVKERGELDYGIGVSPRDFLADIPAFTARWVAERDAFAVMETDTHAALAQAGLPMRIVASDGRRIVVARR
ncbi:MAG: glycosyltransferase family 39 protein [Burkholderiales bacterium]